MCLFVNRIDLNTDFCSVGPIAVSYTHLDVYKRQTGQSPNEEVKEEYFFSLN